MKRLLTISFKILFLVTLFATVLSSCVPQKKIKYFQKKQKEDTTTVFAIKQATEYKVQPNDNLYIRIYSMDEKTNQYFNRNTNASGSGNVQNSQLYFDSYTVSKEGYIEFPVIGKIFVKELTMEQVRNLIQQLVDEYLKETVVVVKMAIFNITLLGEVRSPGEYPVFNDKISIYEAIAKAGDLTDFANRNKVVLVRQVKNDSRIYYMDLTDEKFLTSDLYYLAPNDILYFSPLKIKQWGFGATFPWAFLFSMISFILTLAVFFNVYKP